MTTRKLLIASLFTGVLAARVAVPVEADAAPAAIQHQIDRAHEALSAGDGAAAVALFTKAIESRSLSDIERANALVNRGLAHQTATHYQNAVDDYSAALRLGRLAPTAKAATLYNRGLAYLKLARPELAIDDFTSALFINSGLGHAYFGRANALRDIGDHLFALSDYEKALRYGYPDAHLALYGQAMSYAALGRAHLAEKFLSQALTAKPDFSAARKKLDELRTPAANSFFQHMASRIDEIVAVASSPIAADRVVRDRREKDAEPPPHRLLEAAERVEFASVALPGHRSLSLSQIPNAMSPAFVVAERQFFRKDQERIAAGDQGQTVTIEPVSATIEPVSEPVEPTPAPVEPQAPPIEPATEVPPSGWLVQINSQRNEGAAWSAWDRIKAKHEGLLAERAAVVVKADLGPEGVVFRLRVKDLASKGDAEGLCAKLRKRGQDCYVVRAGA